MKNALHFGAGNIGRGFIGYLLNKSGYHVTFADVFEDVINEINEKKEYTIYVKDVDSEEILMNNISAINSLKDDVATEVRKAEIITTAVGPLNLEKIAPDIASGIKAKNSKNNQNYLNIIACENAINASGLLKELVYKHLTDAEIQYAEQYVGFPNCSVDRIVPPSDNPNPLDVTVEKFYEWNVEKDGFKGDIPNIKRMNLTDNLLAYIERKLFTLNTGHAITAYLGSLSNYQTIDEAIEDEKIFEIVKKAMKESGDALIEKYEFDQDAHYQYIDKIIERFKNPHLNDNVDRVGREPIRKLSENERLVKPLNTALDYQLPVNHLIKGIAAALHFDGDDEQSKALQSLIKDEGVVKAFEEISGITDSKVLEKVDTEYKNIV